MYLSSVGTSAIAIDVAVSVSSVAALVAVSECSSGMSGELTPWSDVPRMHPSHACASLSLSNFRSALVGDDIDVEVTGRELLLLRVHQV